MTALAYKLQVVFSVTLFQVNYRVDRNHIHPNDTLVSLKLGSHFPLEEGLFFHDIEDFKRERYLYLHQDGDKGCSTLLPLTKTKQNKTKELCKKKNHLKDPSMQR